MVLKWIPYIFLCALVYSNEMHCSKFHYEEKMLEKIIRMEIFVNDIKKDLEKCKQGMTDTLTALLTEFQTTKEQVKTIVAKDERELETLKALTATPVVAFSVNYLENRRPTNDETLVFITKTFDHGNGYNSNTGYYTTPVSGVYLFTVQIFLEDSATINFHIMSDDGTLFNGRFVDDGVAHYGCQATTAVAVLNANKRVWVMNKSPGAKLWQHSVHWNSFSGVLVNTLS